MDVNRISKYISLLLRHKPDVGGLTLDHNGWCDTDALVISVSRKFPGFDLDTLEKVVETNNKHRFSFNKDKNKIRANQGHSIEVDVELKVATPPDVLFHGSATKYQSSILSEGLTRQNRLHVHLSKDILTAISVGQRHGTPIVFEVDTKTMKENGFSFYLSENGVWLTDHVPPKFLKLLTL
ncbi:RNA 2'-phosphotransferase [uncultured Parabacteroides sp.]|uniref:RNA 2'-phosphotransferase n=1 Tax=uncultured Parabacteroides sp. TaxID=512312 RepID=UPI002610F674|nr:RNA 2'-phosphotransferase [uncultured Parabacteroides sp.]